jgi:hypothetical protein
MHTDKKRPGQLDRRRLLKGAGLAVGAAAVTSAAGACENGKVASKPDSKPQHAGYRETEDVKTYYKLARY